MWIRLTPALLVAELGDREVAISESTVSWHLKILGAKRKNLAVKPLLTPQHRIDRMRYVLDQAVLDHGYERNIHHFRDNLDTVHVDESWFYLTTVDKQVLLWGDLMEPDHPCVKHKSHIIKVMFLVAMARPQKRPGRVGMWDCTEEVLTKKASINRPAGVLETRAKSIDAEFYQELCTMEGGVLDAVKLAMPWRKHSGIIIQHDGASPHNGKGNDDALDEAGHLLEDSAGTVT